MTIRRLAKVAVILAIGVGLGVAAGSAAEDDEKSKNKSLSVECAEAKLRLAEMNLARARQLNTKVPGTLISGMMDQFAKEVTVAKTELEIAKNPNVNDSFQAAVERMKMALAAAEERAKVGMQTHQKAPTVVTKQDIERMRLFAVIVDLQLQRGEALMNAPAHEKLDWQLEVLGDDVERLRIYTYLLGQNRIGQFFPGGL